MIGIDLKGTLAERREFVSDEMLVHLKDVVLITGQDMKDPQLANLLSRINIPAYTNNGAIFWDGYKVQDIIKLDNQDNLLLLVNKFINDNKIPIHEPPKVWSNVQISLWCKNISLKDRCRIAIKLEKFLNNNDIYVCASGMNTIAIYNHRANKTNAIIQSGCDVYIGDEFSYGNDRELSKTDVKCYSCDPIEYKDNIPLNVIYIGQGTKAVELYFENPKAIYYPRILFPFPTKEQIDNIFLMRFQENKYLKQDIKEKLSNLPHGSILSGMPRRADSSYPHVFYLLIQEIASDLKMQFITEDDFFEMQPRKSMINFETAIGRKEAIKQAQAKYIGISLKGKTVFIFDDIVSTGTSLVNAAKILLEDGANKVFPIGIIQSPYYLWEKEQEERIKNAINISSIV